MSARGAWPLRDRPVVVWLLAAFLVSLVHRFLPESRWLMVHLVLLGAVTHSILVWSTHFAEALLKPGPDAFPRERQSRQLLLVDVGALVVLVSVPFGQWHAAALGGTLVGAGALWHGVDLARALRESVGPRFATAVRYYVAAAALLPVGITYGVLLATGPGEELRGRLLVAHTMINLLGWVGLTVVGTLLTLWPTMLRTRMSPRAERLTAVALPVLVAAVVLVAVGATLGLVGVAAAGLVVYGIGLATTWVAGIETAVRKPPTELATWSVALGQGWLGAGIALLVVTLLRHGSFAPLGEDYGMVTTIFAVGFALQTVIGASSHLLPAVLGGGPAVGRAMRAWLERWGIARVVVTNLGLLICLLPVPSLVRAAVSVLVELALVAFLPLLVLGLRAGLRLKRSRGPESRPESNPKSSPTVPAGTRERPVSSARPVSGGRRGALAGVLALVVVAGVGVALDPTAAGLVGRRASMVAATGHTTAVTVTARDMRFDPAVVSVPLGDRLVITLVNADPTNVHDLVVENGATSGRVGPGGRVQVDVGVVDGPLDAWCSVIGHRQMGMTLQIVTTGGTGTTSAHGGHQMMAGAAGAATAGTPTGAAADLDFARTPTPGAPVHDPVLPPLPPLGTGRVHRMTFTVQEVVVEVAPGVRQKRWTFNGSAPGPTLHGRVGDTFEITLVNKGSMGHSIDFHASNLAPDVPMRTIAPGQSLVYRFTAPRAGIWMYHCSTRPMSAHIAAGMTGAVVIEPPGLPAVDRSYLLVQSEVYLGAQDADVDAAKVSAQTPDAVVFNGVANQYDHHPLPAKVGERVRVWVLDSGPNRSSAFHVVGGQFDTVYHEGGYLLKGGRDAFGGRDGGAQALGLQAAQGGFVELTFPEAGHYPFVSHVMSDAERGAHGLFAVTR